MAELEWLDPESEAQCAAMMACIAAEVEARLAAGTDPRTPEGQRVLAVVIADALLDQFVVRERREPRYRWTER
jgi:hypothetical protein